MKNTRGKRRDIDNPYEAYIYTDDYSGAIVEIRVLRHYQRADKERANRPYARVHCAARSKMTGGSWERGDRYCRGIPGYDWDWDMADWSLEAWAHLTWEQFEILRHGSPSALKRGLLGAVERYGVHLPESVHDMLSEVNEG